MFKKRNMIVGFFLQVLEIPFMESIKKDNIWKHVKIYCNNHKFSGCK